jgi:hypothetical protein
MRKPRLCIYFKSEVSGHLTDTEDYLKDYDGLCLKRRKDVLVKRALCVKPAGCRKWADGPPDPPTKKPRRYYEEY